MPMNPQMDSVHTGDGKPRDEEVEALRARVAQLESADAKRKELEVSPKIKSDQLAAVASAMTVFLDTEDWREASAKIIRSALSQTGSEYGFIGVVVDGPALRILSQEGINWDPSVGRTLYDAAILTYRERGYLEFTDFENLFGRVITDGKAIFANSPASDPRSGGLPAGHPPLTSFMGVPILRRSEVVGMEVVGMIGVANRAEGYTETEQASIQILCRAAGVLFDSYRRKQREIDLLQEQTEAQGELTHFVGIQNDVTARRRAEEALQVAKEEAESANRLKSAFLANMSHEVRTPLTVILGYTALMKQLFPDRSEVLEALEAMEQSGQNLLQIFNDVLDLSKIEAGHMKVERRLCSPTEICTQVLSSMLVEANEKGIALQIHYEGPIPQTILSDPVRVEQALLKLVSNATKFTEAGSVLLSLRLVENESKEKQLEFRVKDTGIGIPKDKLDSIFKPFTQVDPSATRKHEGAGLGLSICRPLARLLGGDVTVSSEVGGGSVFTFAIRCEVPEGVRGCPARR